jgi:predicted DNA-binding protein (UPF0251 family)
LVSDRLEAWMELIEQITVLERALQEHIRKWERFFSGVDRVPPQDEKERITRRIRTQRMLREREEGRVVKPHTDSELRRATAANVAGTGSVDKAEEGSLFDRYQTAKAERGLDVGVDRETFDKQIAEQRKKIEKRLGRKVRFDVQIEDDKVRVVAKKKKG